jgi:hypothetical protein
MVSFSPKDTGPAYPVEDVSGRRLTPGNSPKAQGFKWQKLRPEDFQVITTPIFLKDLTVHPQEIVLFSPQQ